MKISTAPFVCFSCRKQFDRNWNGSDNFKVCPECGDKTIRYDIKFKAPKKSDHSQWKKIEFLRDHGFYFQRVYDIIDDGVFQTKSYPNDLKEAKNFVNKYNQFSIKLD